MSAVKPCSTPGCIMTQYHHGICAVPTRRVERDVKQSVKQGPYGPGEFTPWNEPGERPRLRHVLSAMVFSPLGAVWGLALLVLLWLSGCA